MSAMYRLKAYFGMVPAEEMADYADETVADRYGSARRTAGDFAEERWGDRFDDDEPEDEPAEDWEAARPARSTRPAAPERSTREPARTGARAVTATAGPTATRGSLAIDTDPAPARPLPVPNPLPEQRDRVIGAQALARITTLQPSSYNEARTIGERYRDGQPVIMNLTELDDAAAKRLVDFAAGLAFALRGSIDKVTSRVFLLTPADVEVSADDARKLAERSVSGARVGAGRSFAATRVEERGIFRQD
ncbi:MAG TPA: cell division protein SepF [Pseudonocardia sp.]|nr:cell division protein SepF [Pseudonocardia sp.]